MRRKIFDLEEQRKTQLENIRNIANLTYADRLVREQQVNAEVDRAIELERLRAAEYQYSQTNFVEGWKAAFEEYAKNAGNAANQAKRVFDTFSRSFEDTMVKFLRTGKLSFKDFADTIINEFLRIQAQKAFVSLFGTGGFFGSLFGFANGGPTEAMKPIIVGERGPELFIPKMAGNVISNQNLTKPNQSSMPTITNVTYNISAVDAPSFRALIARDPQFIYNVSEVGRRGQPNRRLA
jgi:phage-related minor tail protein